MVPGRTIISGDEDEQALYYQADVEDEDSSPAVKSMRLSRNSYDG